MSSTTTTGMQNLTLGKMCVSVNVFVLKVTHTAGMLDHFESLRPPER